MAGLFDHHYLWKESFKILEYFDQDSHQEQAELDTTT